jgi:probable HAF family extracellular repeat protein
MRLAGQIARVAAAALAADARTPRSRRPFALGGTSLTLLALLAACSGESLTDPRGLAPTPADLTLTGGVGTQVFPTVPLGDFQPFGVAVGLNDAGQVTGSAFLPQAVDFKAFRWSASTGAKMLTGCCDTMWGNDINDAGVIVGTAQTNAIFGSRGFVATGSSTTPLPILPGADPEGSAGAVAINDAGQIVGASVTPSFTTHAVLWGPTGTIQDLGTLGGTNSEAIDINNEGQVIGSSQTTGDAATHFFLWSSGTGMQDLNTTVDAGITSVVEINDAGQIVGTYTTGGESHAFLYTPGTGLRDLGTLGGTTSAPTGLNGNGDVVGSSTLEDGSTHAFLWTAAEGLEDITALSGVPEVRRLNDNLQTLTGTLAPSTIPRTGQQRPRLVQLQVTQSNAPPTALINAECNGLTCVLDGSGSLDDKPGLTYAWSLGKFPGGSATGAKVIVTYPHTGQRTVTLTVTDAQGLKSSISRTLTITDYPIASFTVECVALTCTFDSGASQTDAPPLEPHWRFGDGETAFNVVTATHTFAQPGTYSVTLEVLDSPPNSLGRLGIITKQVTVGAVERNAPVAAFTYSCHRPWHAHQCAFDASGSTDDAGIVAYTWEWGDGRHETQTVPTVRNIWVSAGTFTVTLRVTDEDGLTSVTSQQVVVP